jgi:hypothetical protein
MSHKCRGSQEHALLGRRHRAIGLLAHYIDRRGYGRSTRAISNGDAGKVAEPTTSLGAGKAEIVLRQRRKGNDLSLHQTGRGWVQRGGIHFDLEISTGLAREDFVNSKYMVLHRR